MFEDLLSVCLHSLPSLYQSLSVESPLVCKITCNQHQHRPKQPLPNRQVENIHCLYGDIILKTQASPVFTDDDVTLCYQHQSGKHKQTSFFKNGALIDSNSSSGSDRVIKMTLKNVTREDEGFYRKLHIRGDSSLHWFLEMDHCFMWGSTSDRHSFDCLARLSLQVPEVLHLELLACFQTGSSSRGASCHQVGCDGGAVGPVVDGDVQPVGKGFLLWHLKGNTLLKPRDLTIGSNL
ncbi:uncharacterized protein LOC128440227 [Pleuronectes platessa]|uniref:uncharacterized protein LOC128440227 n=1 Tax=Pleuronectes platessa TaxID=8262 RepID=UPI00232A719C|nr:uncharacterized protein LOC128440227 [Pleuronectes platessa]XP_053278866.1 uncharacterized protein LOC128440227 [Pleuronectes platessa]